MTKINGKNGRITKQVLRQLKASFANNPFFSVVKQITGLREACHYHYFKLSEMGEEQKIIRINKQSFMAEEV